MTDNEIIRSYRIVVHEAVPMWIEGALGSAGDGEFKGLISDIAFVTQASEANVSSLVTNGGNWLSLAVRVTVAFAAASTNTFTT